MVPPKHKINLGPFSYYSKIPSLPAIALFVYFHYLRVWYILNRSFRSLSAYLSVSELCNWQWHNNPTHLQTPKRIVCFADFADKESLGFGGGVQHIFTRKPLRLRYVADLIILRRAWIKRPAEEKFGNDTAKRPHVYCLAIRKSKQDLWCSVISETQLSVILEFNNFNN